MDNYIELTNMTEKTEKSGKKITIGYCRVSTKSQSITRQIRNIKEQYPDAIIVEEVFTGTRLDDRPKWNKVVMKQVKKGVVDTIVFDSVSRLSRSKSEGSQLYLKLFSMGISLVFIKEPFINTEEYKKALSNQLDFSLCLGDKATEQLMNGIFKSLNKYFTQLATRQVELAFEQAEAEVLQLKQRTREGLLSAKLNRGVVLGRKKGTKIETKKARKCKKFIKKHFEAFGGELTASECAKMCSIARSTFYRYVNSLIENEHEGKNEGADGGAE